MHPGGPEAADQPVGAAADGPRRLQGRKRLSRTRTGRYAARSGGRALKGCLRPEDTLARLGGDEFVWLLEDVEDPSEAVRVAERIVDEVLTLSCWKAGSCTSPSASASPKATPAPRARYDLLRTQTPPCTGPEWARRPQGLRPGHVRAGHERLESENDLRRASRPRSSLLTTSRSSTWRRARRGVWRRC